MKALCGEDGFENTCLSIEQINYAFLPAFSNPWVFPRTISNLTLYVWLKHGRSYDLANDGEFEEFCWWFVTSFARTRNMSSDVLPPEVVSCLKYPVHIADDVTLSRFQLMSYNRSETLKGRYGEITSLSAWAFSFDFFIHNYDDSLNAIFITDGQIDLLSKKIAMGEGK